MAEAPGTPNNTESTGGTRQLPPPPPYRILSKEYMAQQLPHLQEKAPEPAQKPLEFKTNAPVSLPLPSLFPGEVIRMQQHRVVCTDSFEEPAVGAIYVTNFRIIFNGSPISDPDVYDIVYELQNSSTSSKKSIGGGGGGGGGGDSSTINPHLSSGNLKTLVWKKKQAASSPVPPPPPPRQSKFYVGRVEQEEYAGDQEDEGGQEEEDKQVPFAAKWFQRLNTIRRSTGAGIKNAFGDISADIAKLKQSKLSAKNTLSVPITATPGAASDDFLISCSAPNKAAPPQSLTLDSKPVTLPRNMPSHHQETTPPDEPQLNMADSGIVDASIETTSPSPASPPLPATSPAHSASPVSQFSSSGDVFLDVSKIDEIDFERSPVDFPLADDRRRKYGGGGGKGRPRPSSFLGIESDSDSDTITDKYFGSITEEEDDDNDNEGFTSPESALSPSHGRMDYENVVLRVPSPSGTGEGGGGAPGDGGRVDYENVVLKKPPESAGEKSDTTATTSVKEAVVGGGKESAATDTNEGRDTEERERREETNGVELEEAKLELENTVRVEKQEEERKEDSLELERTLKPKDQEEEKKTDLENTIRETQPIASGDDKKEPDIVANGGDDKKVKDKGEPGKIIPTKPPRRKKRAKTSSDDIDGSNNPKRPSLTLDDTDQWSRSNSDGVMRTPTSRRCPPPPPKPQAPPTKPEELSSTNPSSSEVKMSSSETDLSSPSSPPPLDHNPIASHAPLDRNSSLVAVRGSNVASYTRPLTVFSPIKDQPFDWSSGWSTESNRLHDSNSLPLNFSTTSMPYHQYTHSVSLPLSTINSIKHHPQTILEESGIRIPDGVLLLGKNFSSLKLHFHSNNTYDALKFKEFLENIINEPKQFFNFFAFKYRLAIKLPNQHIFDSRKLPNFFHFDSEMERTGLLNAKIKNTQLWRVTTITKTNPDLCPSYPEKLVVLLCTPDVDLLRGGSIYEEGRFPTASWMNQSNGSVLLRAAATTAERGLQSSKLPVDEAILQAIRECNVNSRLFVFTEKSDTTSFHDPNKLTKEAARSYYYHNCHFNYSVNPPTYKSVRHSFNKLQAMLQSNVSDDEYLMTLDGTKWLSRVGDLLATTYEVVDALTEKSAHVLVCYEKGWDRTTQIVSLAQLLCDPYYRTMDGFQVLIQKEWLWFGHPFHSRHSRGGANGGGASRGGASGGGGSSKVKEDGPVFLQWIDCVWQMTRQCPFAFEFNENLLIALVEHAYSNQFGTFMGNSEKERTQCFMIPDHYHQSIYTNTISFWTWVSMVNSSNNIFLNPYYNPQFHQGAIYPKYYQTSLEVWRSHYDRQRLRQESLEGHRGDSRLHRELHQIQKLLMERQPMSSLSLHVGLKRESLQPLQIVTSAIGTDSPQLGPNPLPASAQSVVPRATAGRRNYSCVSSFLVSEGYDPSVCHHVVLSPSKCQGYLTKEGGFMKNWKRRWFVLDYVTKYLAYFESQEHFAQRERPKGVIMLDDIKKVSLSTRRIHLMSNLFQVKTPLRTYSIKAPSIISMEIWMACLKLPYSALQGVSEREY